MNSITIQLAGVNISILYIHDTTRMYFVDFETTEKYKYEVCMTNQRLEEERKLLESRFPTLKFNDVEVERNALYRDVPKVLIAENVIMIHGVLLKCDDEGYLFVAPSGIGKSTHASLWAKMFPDNTSIINGDKPILKLTNSGVIAYGSPWKGKENIGSNQSVKLKSICYLQRGKENCIRPVDLNAKSLSWLLKQTQFSGSESSLPYRVKWFNSAAKHLSLFEMQCNNKNEAAIVAYNGMNKSR